MSVTASLYRLFRAVSVPLCGTIRYAATTAVVCAAWWFDARYLNRAFDANLSLVKMVSFIDKSGQVEAAMRAFSAEKVLLFAEASAIVWLAGWTGIYLFRRLFRRRGGIEEGQAPVVGSTSGRV